MKRSPTSGQTTLLARQRCPEEAENGERRGRNQRYLSTAPIGVVCDIGVGDDSALALPRALNRRNGLVIDMIDQPASCRISFAKYITHDTLE